jgi:hypothetical protein
MLTVTFVLPAAILPGVLLLKLLLVLPKYMTAAVPAERLIFILTGNIRTGDPIAFAVGLFLSLLENLSAADFLL